MNMQRRIGVNRPMTKRYILYALAMLVSISCSKGFYAASFTTMDSLYAGAMKEYKNKNWDNAVKAFERLTHDLDPRDPRLPVSYYYLGKSQAHTRDYLLAATSFTRVSESFPQDSLADEALYESGGAYEQLWRKPELDAQYVDNAINAYRLLLTLYPQSPLVPRAQREMTRLDEWFATKDYNTGYHYLKRKAYDSAIIYFKDVVRLHPDARKTRDAYLRLHEAYRAINYKDDAAELCTAMHTRYPNDREVRGACGNAQAKS